MSGSGAHRFNCFGDRARGSARERRVARMKAQFEMLAAYNAWVNERLYAAAAKIGDADYRADRGAFFGRSAQRAPARLSRRAPPPFWPRAGAAAGAPAASPP
jgi:hypothetical protein